MAVDQDGLFNDIARAAHFYDAENIESETVSELKIGDHPINWGDTNYKELVSGEFRINGIAFPVDPQNISIWEENQNYKYETLRTRESTKVRSGHSSINMSVQAIFAGKTVLFGDKHLLQTTKNAHFALNHTLMPILYSLKKMPLCFLDNELLRTTLPVSSDENIAAFVKSVNVSTVQGMPEVLSATFQFVWYNHRPFAPRIKFRENWLDKTGTVERIADTYRGMAVDTAQTVVGASNAVREGTDGYASHVGRAAFIKQYGHPSIAFNATTGLTATENIYNAAPLREYLWPYAYESTNPAIVALGNDPAIAAMPPFVLSGFDRTINLDFTIVKAPDTVFYKGAERSILELGEQIVRDDVIKEYTFDDNETNSGSVPVGYVWPLSPKGRLSSHTGARTLDGATGDHQGIDIHATRESKVLAVADGKVYYTSPPGQLNDKAGYFIEISHRGGVFSRYLHLTSVNVKKNDIVRAGDVIGLAGNTGVTNVGSSGDERIHLHFELRTGGPKGPYVPDPEKLLKGSGEPHHTVSTTSRLITRFDPADILSVINKDLEDMPEDTVMSKINKFISSKMVQGSTLAAQAMQVGAGPALTNLISGRQAPPPDSDAQTLTTAINRLISEGWHFERDLNTGKPAQIRYLTLSARSDSADIIPQEINFGFGTNLAMTPLQGHRFPTVQYVGGQQSAITIAMRAEGKYGREYIRKLKDLIASTEESAIHFREFTKYRGIGITNQLINSVNINEVILEDMTVDAIPGNPESLQIVLRFVDNSRDKAAPPFLVPRDEVSQDDAVLNAFAYILDQGWIQIAIEKETARIRTGKTRAEYNPYAVGAGVTSVPILTDEIDVYKLTPETRPLLHPNIVQKQLTNIKEYIRTKEYVARDGGLANNAPYNLYSIDEYKELSGVSMPLAFKDYKFTEIIWNAADNTIRDPVSKAVLTNKLFEIIAILGTPQSDGIPLDPYFAKLLTEIGNTVSFVKGNECYPDLLLPPNPITGLTVDTLPDFFLYNESDVSTANSNILRMVHGSIAEMPKTIGLRAAMSAMENTWDNLKDLYGEGDGEGLNPANEGRTDEDTGVGVYLNYGTKTGASGNGVFKHGNESRNVPPDLNAGILSIQIENGDKPARLQTDISSRYDRNETNRDKALDFNYASSPYKDIIKSNPSINAHQMQHVFHKGEYERLFNNFADNYSGEHFAIRRSFPTFKIYFVDENAAIGQNTDDQTINNLIYTMALDDFYGVNAVKEIRIVENKDMAASTCIISILDLDGVLYNRKFMDPSSEFGSRDSKKSENNNPFGNTMITEGMKVVVKLGHMNDPYQLKTCFVGQIVQFEGTDLVEIICQSYGTELVQQTFGSKPAENANFYNTYTVDLIHDVMDREELRHFGRWELKNIDALGFYLGHEKLRPDGQTKTVWTWKPSVVDDNIFAPPAGSEAGWWDKFAGNLEYVLWNTTIWDVLKEMELRNPGHIAYPVPYGNTPSARMTMFFGVPGMEYLFAPAETPNEQISDFYGQNYNDAVKQSIISLGNHWIPQGIQASTLERLAYKKGIEDLATFFESPGYAQRWDLSAMQGMTLWSASDIANLTTIAPHARAIVNKIHQLKPGASNEEFWKATMIFNEGRMKSFRNYELITSVHDIIANEIRTDHRDTYNSIELRYTDGLTAVDNDVDFIEFQNNGNVGTFTANLDDNIKEHHIRRNIENWPNCSTPDLARRYASQLLANSLKRTYKGYLMIMGRPNLKPYDYIYLNDAYSDMSGPLEIEEVVHTFSQETGFITEIVPNMIVTVKDEVSLMTADMMTSFFAETCKHMENEIRASSKVGWEEETVAAKGLGAGVVIGAGILAVPTFASISGILSGYLAYKYVKYCQTREPIVIIPLIKEGKPYVTGIESMESDGLVLSDIFDPTKTDKFIDRMAKKKWRYWVDGIKDANELIQIGWANWLTR